MFSNLLLYRFIIFNGLMIAVTAVLGWSGYLLPLFQNDQSRLTFVITALFLMGWLWSWRKAVQVSFRLNDVKRRGARPACEAQRDKELAKTEWLSTVSEWLVALGLLGTVVGFSMALSGVDQGGLSTAAGVQSAVAQLMQGMRVALNTTLLGASFALWHEVNIRMLKTALAVYWGERVAVWQIDRPWMAERPVTLPSRYDPDHATPIPINRAPGKPPVAAKTAVELERMKP
ncbi:MotA/TolQ/ExbB proton channel family protein [Allomesorhizobium camelthorni]|uniref:MotA/TolQ/ExbB proton channel family protein n=1 Tax=Allomesorhizobium camelthorni TaxID=475069 RepID=A0A6G4WII4_9HYPH|nr:MotA/TolQ/ExbB proton channel family protein [Mesorhizobium camelthorni]NGO54168.1 MotA/TolQ/ExbB proton channel family protein [Mesorhizobium camelthorni]